MNKLSKHYHDKYGKANTEPTQRQQTSEARKNEASTAAKSYAENLILDENTLEQMHVKVGNDEPIRGCLNGQVRLWCQLNIPIGANRYWKPPVPKAFLSMKKADKLLELKRLVNLYRAKIQSLAVAEY